MTSARKLAANRANARHCTGPKTRRGKARASQNARRHGLNVSVLCDPALSKDVEVLAGKIVRESAGDDLIHLARCAAEALVELKQIRRARLQLLSDALSDPEWDSHANFRAKLGTVVRCARTMGPLTPMPDNLVEYIYSRPKGSEKFTMILADKLHELFVLDRYERRALSKRKCAIRSLDEARCRLLPTDV